MTRDMPYRTVNDPMARTKVWKEGLRPAVPEEVPPEYQWMVAVMKR